MSEFPARAEARPGIRSSLLRSRADALAVFPLGLAAFAMLAIVFPPYSGVLALALVLEVHLFIAFFLVFAPIEVLTRSRLLGLALALLVALGGCLYGSEWISLPGSAAARTDVTVLSWNLQHGSKPPTETVTDLQAASADMIGLEELDTETSLAIEGDPTITARYPYRVMRPQHGVWGVGFLSRFPIVEENSFTLPSTIEATVETPQGGVHVITCHSYPASMTGGLLSPLSFDPTERDRQIALLRTRIQAVQSAGPRLLVVGDFNTSPSESEYRVLTAGLRDSWVEVGEGPGWTWRPGRLEFAGMGFLRIDLQLTSGSIRPSSLRIDCSHRSDHCQLVGGYELD